MTGTTARRRKLALVELLVVISAWGVRTTGWFAEHISLWRDRQLVGHSCSTKLKGGKETRS